MSRATGVLRTTAALIFLAGTFVASGLAGGAVASPLAAASDPSASGELSATGARSFADLSSCLSGADHFLASVVVDESGSLQQTDPGNDRVGAIQAALSSLASLQTSAGTQLDVEADLGVFGGDYTQLVGWGSVAGGHADALDQAVTQQIPSRNQAAHTDYRAALQGAEQSIDARADQLDGTTCSAILWFTDGRLDLDENGDGPQTQAARLQLCQPQGIVDGVRADGTTIIAMALFGGQSSGVTADDRARLKAIAEGRGGSGQTCGTVPIPATSQGGAYLRADQPDALRRLFAGVGALVEGGTPALSGVECPGAQCPDGRLEIPLDAGVAGFRVIVELPDGGAAPTLLAPDGTTVPLGTGKRTVGDATVTASSRDGLVVADVTRADHAAGTWRLVTAATAAGPDVVDLYYFWGARLKVAAPDGLVVGKSNDVDVTLTGADGQPVVAAELTGPTLTATVDGAAGKVVQQADGSYRLTVTLPSGRATSAVHVEVTARARSVPHDVSLGPVAASAALKTSLPPSYPTLEPSALALPDVVGKDASSGHVTVHGSDRGATKACFGAGTLAGPSDAGNVTLASAGCVDVPKDKAVDVKLTVHAQHPADGHASGTVPVKLTAAGGGEPVTLDLPVSLGLVRPVDQGKRAGLVALLVLGALALAWLVADVGRRRSDRYPLGPGLAAAAVPVVADASGVRRRGGGDLLQLDDFRRLDEPHARGRFETQGLRFARSFRWWWPWSPGQARVRAANERVVATNGRSGHVGDAEGTWAPAAFAATRQFYLVADPPGPSRGSTPPAAPTDGATDGAPAAAADGPGEITGTLVVLVDGRHGVAQPLEAATVRLDTYPQWPDLVADVHAAHAARDEARPVRGAVAPAGAVPRPDTAPTADDAPPHLFATGGDPGGRPGSGAAAPDGPPPRFDAGSDAPDPRTARLPGRAPRPASPPPPAPPPASPPSDDDGPPPNIFH